MDISLFPFNIENEKMTKGKHPVKKGISNYKIPKHKYTGALLLPVN
jgi:hypothetical protein